MRIALAHSHPETFGGGERALLELARGLTPAHQVRLLVGSYRARQTYAELAWLPRREMRASQWLTTRPAADAIVANSFGANLLALRSGRRTIYWVHSLRSRFLRPCAVRPDLLARRALDRLAVRRAARVVANSHFAARKMHRLYKRGPDAVVYPGVDLEAFSPPPVHAGATYAVTVGRLAPEKGLERLLLSWGGLPGVPLVVIGDGEAAYVQRLRDMATKDVQFRGPLSPEQVADAYRAATLAVFTPHDEEFGIAPVEAMACGLPVVAWRDGGLQETVVDGQTGYLVEGAVGLIDRVAGLMRQPFEAAALGRAARERAACFPWTRSVAAIERLCREVSG